MADLSHLKNFIAISDRLGTSGQPTGEQIADIGAAGYQVVINLAMGKGENALANEGDLVAQQGMEYIHIPVVWDDPQTSDFDLFAEVLTAHREDRVLAHYVVNMRVSAFVFLYRIIHQQVDPAEAKRTMQQMLKRRR